jgi:uncharacterized protein YyaL (SSP411 family)
MKSNPPRSANRLAHETSPYLLQHAWNPVDWRPWGDDAFAAAREADKPIFLSVGYSACHWCHVMEHESFENDEIARFLNAHFIAIKVDREERPDVDAIYMTAVQLISQRGGWPMSVFLTPTGEPFFGGTYWPPQARMGMPGFLDILRRLADIWETQRDEAVQAGTRLVAAIQRVSNQSHDAVELGDDLLREAEQDLVRVADRQYGGFGPAPKFPHPMDLRLLLRTHRRFSSSDSLVVATLTLDRMAAGGIYDQLGGGFHRYSTDRFWLAPHFEKMLYDNALLVPAYVEAWQVTGNSDFRRIVIETLDYVLREMTDPNGGLYSTQDADSEGEEGRFFVWTRDAVLDALDAEAGELFCAAYDVTREGNWEGHTILRRVLSDEELAARYKITADDVSLRLARSRHTLFAMREQRVHPGRDDKILADWNGLMIAALAQAGRALDEPRYITAAELAADFVLTTMRDERGRLLHSYKDGRARFEAYLADYAALIDGLVELHQATQSPRHLEAALALAEQMLARYADATGGFFQTADDHESLITRPKDLQDNATPSGNSLAATALLKLGRLTGRTDLADAGYRTLEALSGLMAEHPRAASQALLALDAQLGPAWELVIIDPAGATETALPRELATKFQPRLLVLHRPIGVNDDALSPAIAPLCENRPALNNQRTYYLCSQGTCQMPTNGLGEILAKLA